jgi:hypothetical protein
MSDLLNSASLVMIPSGYKEDTVYSQIPTDGSGDLSFTRASNGTRINSAGLVEVVPWNLLQYSEDFSNAYWTKVDSPVMAYNVATAPNGTMTATSIQSNSASYYQSITATTLSVAPNSTVTLSIYIKKETTKTYFGGSYLQFTGATAKITYVLFDEVNGTINIVAPDQISMVTSVESVGNWWRFIVTGTDTGSNTNLNFGFYGTLSQNGTSLSPGIGSARTIWGAQLNIGSTAKPYFPTTDRLNVPRLTYQNGGGGCPSLLLEKQSTNSAFPSEDFSGYTGSGATISTNQATSPDGTTNADLIYPASSGNFAGKYLNIAQSTTGVVSCFVKQASKRYAIIGTDNNSLYTCIFDLQTATVVYQATNYTGKIENVGNGWYRISAVYTSSSAAAYPFIGVADNSSGGVVVDGTNGLYIWGFQYELNSSYPTSYIPTTSSSATRVADECTKTGIGALIGGTSGTVFFDIKTNPVLSSASYKQFCYYFDSASAQSYMYLGSTNLITTNSNWGSLSGATPLVANTRYKIALVYAPNDFALYVNGVSVATASSGTPKDNDRVSIGQLGGGENAEFVFNQYTHFPSRLTNAELASLTTI